MVAVAVVFCPSISIAKPTAKATKIICKGLPSTKGAKKLEGIIPKIILKRLSTSKEAVPSKLKGKNGNITATPKITTTKVIIRMRLIIRLPIVPNVAISPML